MEFPLYVFEWKREPESPPHNIYEVDSWVFDDSSAASYDLTASILPSEAIVKYEVTSNESKAEVVSKLLEDLHHLDELDDFVKEEPFSSWLEEKIDLPIFENIHIEPPRGFQQPRFKTEELKPISPVLQQSIQNVPQQINSNNIQVVQGGNNILPPQDTNLLLQEFETVFDHVEMTHGQLTPPQSPPLTPHVSPSSPLHSEQVLTPLTPMNASTFQILQNTGAAIYFQQPGAQIVLQVNNVPQQQIQQIVQNQHTNVISQAGQRAGLEMAPGTPQPDVAHELAVVEELVRSRAENMVESWNNSPSNYSSKAIPMIHSPSSPSSSSSSGFSEYSSDPEWIPEPVHNTISDGSLVDKPSRGRKRAGKPYSRIGPEDKKSRKKEQNKNAATRYRLKKKAEIEEILSEEKGLIDVKVELQATVTDLQREIKCLKGLMRDLFKAKGLIQ